MTTVAERAENDLKLWNQWNDNGRKPKDLVPLLNAFRPMIKYETSKFSSNVELPPAAIQGEFTKQFVKAVETYKPDRGSALGSWVTLSMRKGHRWITQRQNTVRIAENITSKITDYNNAVTQLTFALGRPPNDQEIAEKLKLSVAAVGRIRSQQRKDFIGSTLVQDPSNNMYSKEKEILRMLPYDLTPDELFVYEHLRGLNGKRVLSGAEIAKVMNTSPAKISRLRASIERKARVYL